MRDPLSEALDALRTLADPARAWGYPPADGMRAFAEGAYRNVRRAVIAERKRRDR